VTQIVQKDESYPKIDITELEQVAKDLTKKALENGSKDNISVAIIDVF
jgi:serine/threonine protein phosphatase PrpC